MHCALEIRCKTSCKKCHIHSIYLQFPFLIYTHFFVTKNYLCTFLSQNEFEHTFFVANTVYAFFFAQNNLRTSCGKFLRVESCHPENSDFLGLCWHLPLCPVEHCGRDEGLLRRSHLKPRQPRRHHLGQPTALFKGCCHV